MMKVKKKSCAKICSRLFYASKSSGIFIRHCAFLVLGLENVTDKEGEAADAHPGGSTAGTNSENYGYDPDAKQIEWHSRFFSFDTGSKSELKILIEKEVREQLSLVSEQLDQQMKITEECYSRAVETSRPNKHA